MKKQDLLIKGMASLVALVAVAGIATASFAFNGNGISDNEDPRGRGYKMSGMTEEERAGWLENMEAERSVVEERRQAIEAALEAGDYNAWLEAVGDNCPMAERINEGNFSKLMEAHNLREQARGIMEELGVERGMSRNGGMGHGGAGCPGFRR
jgi:hypothetical protein